MSASALLKSRVRRPSYLNKIAKAEDLIDLFPHGTYIGWSGFTGVGYPKYEISIRAHTKKKHSAKIQCLLKSAGSNMLVLLLNLKEQVSNWVTYKQQYKESKIPS